MKNKFLNDLKEYLIIKNVRLDEVSDIIDDYESLINEGLSEGITIEEILNKFGTPKDIYLNLKNDLSYERHSTNKITSLSVFLVLIVYILSGMVLNLWAYNWMLFLLIPIISIITNSKWPYMMTQLSPFISVIIFYTFGLLYNIWHPLWLIFLIVPLSGIIFTKNNKDKLLGASPFISLIIYIILGFINSNYYLYFWPVFLLTPLLGTFVIENKKVRYITLTLLITSIIGYLALSFSLNNFAYPLFIFLLPLSYGIYTKEIQVHVNLDIFKSKTLSFLLLLIVTSYLLFSFLVKNSWTYSWTILLFIPMLFIYNKSKFKKLVEYMPFVSLMLFYLFGYFFNNGFKYSWLFFFLIPITAILFEKNSVVIKENIDNSNKKVD